MMRTIIVACLLAGVLAGCTRSTETWTPVGAVNDGRGGSQGALASRQGGH